MTVNVYIYCFGSGQGHVRRGETIAASLRKIGHNTALVSTPGDLEVMTNSDISQSLLVMDTFPLGISDEMTVVLPRFKKRVLVARYSSENRHREYDHIYDAVIAPYDPKFDEWSNKIPNVHYSGVILHRDRLQVSRRVDGCLSVLDHKKRMSQHMKSLVTKIANNNSLKIKFVDSEVCAISSQKILIVGAGYNTFYETAGSGADVRYIPLYRRWDDQHMRASKWNLDVTSPRQLNEWMSSKTALFRNSITHTEHTLTNLLENIV